MEQNDDLRRKLEDFDKVTKVKRSMTVDTAEHDREIRELKNRFLPSILTYSLHSSSGNLFKQAESRGKGSPLRADYYQNAVRQQDRITSGGDASGSNAAGESQTWERYLQVRHFSKLYGSISVKYDVWRDSRYKVIRSLRKAILIRNVKRDRFLTWSHISFYV